MLKELKLTWLSQITFVFYSLDYDINMDLPI